MTIELNSCYSIYLLSFAPFTQLEMIPYHPALYTMRCPKPFWFRAVPGSAGGLDFRIIPVGFDNPLGFES